MVDWSSALGYNEEDKKYKRNTNKKKCCYCNHFYTKKDMKVNMHGHICEKCYKEHFTGISRYEKEKLKLPKY